MTRIAGNLREFRREKGYTQEDAAMAVHVSAQSVSKWRRAENSPDIDLLPELRGCEESLFEREDLVATICEWGMPRACRAMSLDAQWTDDFVRRFADAVPALPRQIVHRDPNPDNILLRGAQMPAFLDFDLTRVLPRIFDIGYATGVPVDAFARTDDAQKRFFTLLYAPYGMAVTLRRG